LKRAFDIIVASLLLFISAPAMAIIAVLIRLDSPGPVLFRQHRTGFGGRTFEIVKFRTMHVLEDGEAVVQAKPHDARVTSIGARLRVMSLDELPQLFNVLSGEMSLVGPRPHAEFHDRYYAALIEDYVLRQRVKPGLTGWAQVNGHRGPTPTLESMEARVRCDVWYARHTSLALDLRILLRTPLAVLSRKNAL
jgi:putative colanic acid biosynthesis UDP-glucose lipid carrier transferase